MKKEISQSNIDKKKITKRKSPSYDPDCTYSWRTIPISLAIVEKWAQELKDYPKTNPDAKTITEFYVARGLSKSAYNNLVNKHEVLKEAHETTMRILGERLWGRAVDRNADWKAVHFMLHNYGNEFKEANSYHSALAEKNAAPTVVNVITDPIPSSDKVKELKDEIE